MMESNENIGKIVVEVRKENVKEDLWQLHDNVHNYFSRPVAKIDRSDWLTSLQKVEKSAISIIWIENTC